MKKTATMAYSTALALALPLATPGTAAAESPKDIRDAFASYHVADRVASATSAIKAACGVDVRITIAQDGFTHRDAVQGLPSAVDAAATFAAAYCTDAPSKREFAEIKVFAYSQAGEGKESSAAFNKSTGVLSDVVDTIGQHPSDGQLRTTFDAAHAKH